MSRFDPDLGWVHSALTLRLWLGRLSLVVCVAGAVVCFAAGVVWLAIVLIVLAVATVGDIVVVIRRLRRGDPG